MTYSQAVFEQRVSRKPTYGDRMGEIQRRLAAERGREDRGRERQHARDRRGRL